MKREELADAQFKFFLDCPRWNRNENCDVRIAVLVALAGYRADV